MAVPLMQFHRFCVDLGLDKCEFAQDRLNLLPVMFTSKDVETNRHLRIDHSLALLAVQSMPDAAPAARTNKKVDLKYLNVVLTALQHTDGRTCKFMRKFFKRFRGRYLYIGAPPAAFIGQALTPAVEFLFPDCDPPVGDKYVKAAREKVLAIAKRKHIPTNAVTISNNVAVHKGRVKAAQSIHDNRVLIQQQKVVYEADLARAEASAREAEATAAAAVTLPAAAAELSIGWRFPELPDMVQEVVEHAAAARAAATKARFDPTPAAKAAAVHAAAAQAAAARTDKARTRIADHAAFEARFEASLKDSLGDYYVSRVRPAADIVMASMPVPAPAAQVPAPAAQAPVPAAQVPAPAVQVPAPAAQVPTPAAQVPAPAVQVPAPAAQVPAPAVQAPVAPVRPKRPNTRAAAKQPNLPELMQPVLPDRIIQFETSRKKSKH